MDPAKMEDYDGFIFGLSGRFGTFPAQMKVCFRVGVIDANGSFDGKVESLDRVSISTLASNRLPFCH